MTRRKIGRLRVSLGVRSSRRLLGLTIVLRGLSELSFILNLLELMVCSALVEGVKAICNFPFESESTRIISGLRWIGLFSKEKVTLRAGNLIDTLCARQEELMKYGEGEGDLVMLQHKFVVEWTDGFEVGFL